MNRSTFLAIDHVQLAMPQGEEPAARGFYAGILGMEELPKPPNLAARGGAWFASGSVQLHLGVENEFRPAKKAHPALRCSDYDALLQRLAAANVTATPDEEIPGVRRCYIHDCFGNRMELIEGE